MNPPPIAAKKANSGNAPWSALRSPTKTSGKKMQSTVRMLAVMNSTTSTKIAVKLNVTICECHTEGFHRSAIRKVKKKNGRSSVGGSKFIGASVNSSGNGAPVARASKAGLVE